MTSVIAMSIRPVTQHSSAHWGQQEDLSFDGDRGEYDDALDGWRDARAAGSSKA